MDEAQRKLNVGRIFQMELCIPQGVAIYYWIVCLDKDSLGK